MFQISGPPFQLCGVFEGFVRTREGKKRLVLRTSDGELLLKVERGLRRDLSGRLSRGTEIALSGEVRTARFTGESKRVVTRCEIINQVAPTVAAAPSGTIRVCAKKNCWKQGGRELWRALEGEIEARGWSGSVRLKAVDCLDECKHAPNLECEGCIHRHSTPAQACALLDSLESSSHP